MFSMISLMYYSVIICNLNGVMKTMYNKKYLNNYRTISYNNIEKIEKYPLACAGGNNNNNNNNNTNYSIINFYHNNDDDDDDDDYDDIQHRISIQILLTAYIAHIDMNNFIWQTRKTNTYYHNLYYDILLF